MEEGEDEEKKGNLQLRGYRVLLLFLIVEGRATIDRQ